MTIIYLKHPEHGTKIAMMEMEAQSQAACLQSEDFQEGATAFYEKRPPQFKGK